MAGPGQRQRNAERDGQKRNDDPNRGPADYQLDLVQIANLSGEDWENVEVWVNKKYVVFIPTYPAGV